MTAETLIFVLTIVVGLIHIGVLGAYTVPAYGFGQLMGSRDNMGGADNIGLQRAMRANNNFRETAPWALSLLVLVQVTGDAGTATAVGGWLYLVSRLIYIPCYLYGLNPWRTIVWTVSLLGILIMLLALL